MSETETRKNRKVRQGKVVSNKMDKTIVVRVDRRFRHSLYKKVVTQSRKYYVHDAEGVANTGDTVSIGETRPLSKLKRWELVEVVRRAATAA